MKKMYHCFDGIHVPSIEIKKDLIHIKCPKSNLIKKMKIVDYCDECMESCECGGFPIYYYQNQFYCKNCFPNIIYKNSYKNRYNFLIHAFRCPTHKEYFNYYCKDCEQNLCKFCLNNHQNHLYLPDADIMEKNRILRNFIEKAQNKIEEIKIIINEMESELDLYNSLIFDKDYIVNKEKILNLENLKIFDNIEEKEKIFVEKMNGLINELKFFINFEYTNKFINEKNSIMDVTSKEYYNYSFIKNNVNDRFNNSIDILSKSVSNIKPQENSEIFITKISNLFEINAIHLENIEMKNKFINNLIVDISDKLEDSKQLNERNNFLISVSNIARISHSYSYELAKLLIKQFHQNNKFSSIIYEKAKVELSSWVNQSLIFLNNNNGIKDIRNFYDLHCKLESNRIFNYIKNEEKIKIFFSPNFNFQILFRDLSQLYTEVLLFSGKNIEINYSENTPLKSEYMKDINDKRFGRYVLYTVLPGLFVNNEIISNAKMLVYCGNPKSCNIPKFIKVKKKELDINDTIKIANIKKIIKCNLSFEGVEKEKNSNYSNYIIKINTTPNIPEKDHPKFSLYRLAGNSKFLIEEKEVNVFKLKQLKVVYHTIIMGTVELSGIIIEANNTIVFNEYL